PTGRSMTKARLLYLELGYSEFRNFDHLICRCINLINNGLEKGIITPSYVEIKIGSGATRVIKDYDIDEGAERLLRHMASRFKAESSYPIRNETALFGLLKKFCQLNGIDHEYQFNLDGFLYDFRYEKTLIEFDENHHKNRKQQGVDDIKNKIALDNGYEILRFNFDNDIIDIIQILYINNMVIK